MIFDLPDGVSKFYNVQCKECINYFVACFVVLSARWKMPHLWSRFTHLWAGRSFKRVRAGLLWTANNKTAIFWSNVSINFKQLFTGNLVRTVTVQWSNQEEGRKWEQQIGKVCVAYGGTCNSKFNTIWCRAHATTNNLMMKYCRVSLKRADLRRQDIAVQYTPMNQGNFPPYRK